MYLDQHNEFLKARNGKGAQSPPQGGGTPAPVYDITSGAPVPKGFQTRRAG
jgi:hypothetical protein